MSSVETEPTTPSQVETTLTEGLKEKKEPSLGELNPLLFPPKLDNPEVVEALKIVTYKNIDKHNGYKPASIESIALRKIEHQELESRLIIRFETESLTESQIALLEKVVSQTYNMAVRTRTGIHNNQISPSAYPRLEQPSEKKSKNESKKILGWYMGPNSSPLGEAHMGLLVYRDLGDKGMADFLRNHKYQGWFFKDDLVTPMKKPVQSKYLVEIREADLYQTDIVEFATQVSSVLSKGEVIDNSKLKYEIYNDLNRLGLKKTQRDKIHGLDDEIDRIERVLTLPLANLDASASIDLQPGSALLVGVPGTGKTLIVENMLQQDNGVFLLPVDPLHLAEELAAPPEKKKVLPRISEVYQQTQIPVIIHIDDIENIAKEDQVINSTLLNLMAGVRESGFFVIASTNYPEKLTAQLLQPQRFAHVIYFGLPTGGIRRQILDDNATQVSKEMNKALFQPASEREIILNAIAKHTEDYTPRYLAEICTEAKSFYLQKIAKLKQTKIGLLESDLEDTFNREDWEKAFIEVKRKYDKTSTQKRDRQLKEFARQHSQTLGFNQREQQADIVTLRNTFNEQAAAFKQESE